MSFSAIAFVPVYNEADILPWTIQHLLDQGVAVYIVDNWSTDNSAWVAKQFPIVGYEKFPDAPSKYYSWRPILERIAKLARECEYDWCLLNDSDEIRRSPHANETLLQGMHRIHDAGFDAINFSVYHFYPTDDLYTGDPEKHFRYYSMDGVDATLLHVKAWKRTQRVTRLSESGGHYGTYVGASVYPEKWILKHYPIRTSQQAERKVVHERLERYDPAERVQQWHVQYNSWDKTNWLRDPKTLKEWAPCCGTV